MIFRNATFNSLPVKDAAKISYWEWFLNIGTEILYEELRQDVMNMTTRDWLFAMLIPLRIMVVPFATWFNKWEANKLVRQSTPCTFVTYSQFRLYWRNWDDFTVAPSRYRKR